MKTNNKLEDSLSKIFSSSNYKMVDVSSKEVTHRKSISYWRNNSRTTDN